MKRILLLILVLTLSLSMLIGCQVVDKVKDLVGLGGEQGGEQVPNEDNNDNGDNDTVVDLLPDAVKFLHNLYKDKNETTPRDFDIVGQVLINTEKGDSVKFPVTWTCDNENVVIRPSVRPTFYTVDLPTVNEEEFSYTLTATITDPATGKSEQKSYTFKVPVLKGIVSDLEEGVAYKISFNQLTHGQRFFLLNTTQSNQNKFINATTDPKEAVDFYVEIVDGGYKFYTDIDGVKNYVYATTTNNDGKISKYIGFSAENSSVFTYDSTVGAWYTTIEGLQYGVGTYSDFKTLSISDWSFFTTSSVGSTQFVAEFITSEYAETLVPDQGIQVETPPANSNVSIKDALDLGVQMPSYTDDKYYVTGIVDEIANTTYGNLYIKDADGNRLYVYGTYDATGANRFDAMENQPQVGDTITVYGVIGQYNGTAQMKNAWITAINGENIGGGTDTPVNPPEGDVADSAVLDLMGNANLVSGSAQQNIFAANGITFTNDKASSTSDLTVQASYAQRAYAGSTIKIEYPGMTKIVITFDDYSPDGTKTYMAGLDGMTVEGATFSRENDVLTITFAAPTNVFQSTALTSQVRIEKIEVYTGEVETPVDPGTGTEPKPETPAYTAPVAGQAYDLYMELPTGKVYFAGSMSGDYLATTTDAAASVKIYFEAVDGGYHIYFMNGDVKTYITAAAYLKSNGYAGCHFSLTTETPALAWTYNTEYGIIEIYDEVEGKSDTFFAGTYGTYSTVSLSGAYYKDQIASGTQYPARIELAEGGEVTPPAGGEDVHEHNFVDGKCSCGETDPNYVPPVVEPDDGTMSIPEVLASASGTSVVVKGTVCEIYQSWNDQYSNISFYIKDEAGNKLLAYRCKGTKVVVGDVVTITGTTTLYSNTIQIAEGCTVVIDVKHVCSTFTEGSCTADSYCTVCGELHAAATGHNYVDGTCANCGSAEPTGDFLPGNLAFSGAANKASADDYMKANFPEWKITGKLGQTYGGYLGFGRSGDSKSAITSSAFSVSSEFTITTVLKGNGSSGVATSTLTFTLIDAEGNTIATGYADGSSTAAITPVDAKDTTYNISFTFVEGKTWTDVSNLVITFAKSTGNIGLKSLDFVQ